MSRRITFISTEEISRCEAIRPRQDDQETCHRETIVMMQTQNDVDHYGMTVIHVSSTKEVIKEGETVSSEVDHRGQTLIIEEYLPQNTASEEVLAGGDEATRPSESGQRLRELVRKVLKRVDKLLYDCFLQEFAKEFGKEAAKLVASGLKWLLILLVLYLTVHC